MISNVLIDETCRSISNGVMETKVIQKTNAFVPNVTNPSRSGSTLTNTFDYLTGREKNTNVIYVPIVVTTRLGYKNTSTPSTRVLRISNVTNVRLPQVGEVNSSGICGRCTTKAREVFIHVNNVDTRLKEKSCTGTI